MKNIFAGLDVTGPSKGTKCIVYQQGDLDRGKQYDRSVHDAALEMGAAGLGLHLIAMPAKGVERSVIAQYLAEVVTAVREQVGDNLVIQAGGGINSDATAQQFLNYGADRIIVGTAAVTDKSLIPNILQKLGRSEQVIVSIDTKDGKTLTIKQGTETVSVKLEDFLAQLQETGVQNVLAVDFKRQGISEGPNYDLVKLLQQHGFTNVIPAGGVATPEHLRALVRMGIAEVTLSKALLDGTLSVEQIRSFLPPKDKYRPWDRIGGSIHA